MKLDDNNNFDSSIWDYCISRDYSNNLKYKLAQNFHKPDSLVYVQFIPHHSMCLFFLRLNFLFKLNFKEKISFKKHL